MKKNQPTSRFIFGRANGRISNRPRRRRRAGLTLTELVVAMVIVVIVVLALGAVIADSVRGWNRMYDRVYADIRADSFVARKTFDQVIRKATSQMFEIDDAGGEEITVYYYSTSTAPDVDRYARFYTASRALLVERGEWTPGAESPKAQLRTDIVCENVDSCEFEDGRRSGERWARMVLTLNDGSQNIVVATSAVMHNSS